MNRKYQWLAAFLVVAFGIVALTGGPVVASGRLRDLVTKVFQNEGDTREGIHISLLSSAWTKVLAADATRRAAVLKNLASAPNDICLSSVTTASNTMACDSTDTTSKMIYLEIGDTYSDYSEAVMFGRVEIGGSSVSIYGMEFNDSED